MQENQQRICKTLPRLILGFPKELFNIWNQKYGTPAIIVSDTTSSLSEDVEAEAECVSQPLAMRYPQNCTGPGPNTSWRKHQPCESLKATSLLRSWYQISAKNIYQLPCNPPPANWGLLISCQQKPPRGRRDPPRTTQEPPDLNNLSTPTPKLSHKTTLSLTLLGCTSTHSMEQRDKNQAPSLQTFLKLLLHSKGHRMVRYPALSTQM